MIRLEIDCNDCMHNDICKFKNNAKTDMERWKRTLYSKDPNSDYDWETMSNYRHVDITFSCPDFQVNIVKRDLDIKAYSDD